jgi:hypothetical protein
MPEPEQTEFENDQPSRAAHPVATFKQGGVEVSVWRNSTENGEMFNTTVRNAYKDAEGNWKETKTFSPTDLASPLRSSEKLTLNTAARKRRENAARLIIWFRWNSADQIG